MLFALAVQCSSHANSWGSPSFWFGPFVLTIMEGGPPSPLGISPLPPFVWHNVEGSASNLRCHFTILTSLFPSNSRKLRHFLEYCSHEIIEFRKLYAAVCTSSTRFYNFRNFGRNTFLRILRKCNSIIQINGPSRNIVIN